jgi:hypothetical protein
MLPIEPEEKRRRPCCAGQGRTRAVWHRRIAEGSHRSDLSSALRLVRRHPDVRKEKMARIPSPCTAEMPRVARMLLFSRKDGREEWYKSLRAE